MIKISKKQWIIIVVIFSSLIALGVVSQILSSPNAEERCKSNCEARGESFSKYANLGCCWCNNTPSSIWKPAESGIECISILPSSVTGGHTELTEEYESRSGIIEISEHQEKGHEVITMTVITAEGGM